MDPFTIGSIHDILATTSFRNPWCLRFRYVRDVPRSSDAPVAGPPPHYGTSPAETTVGAPGSTGVWWGRGCRDVAGKNGPMVFVESFLFGHDLGVVEG